MQRILDVAMEIASREGFAALSMNKLADACDYTPGALYRYFDSKDLLLSALLHRILDEVRANVAANIAAVPADQPLTLIAAITRGYWRYSVEQPHKFSLIARAFGAPRMIFGSADAAEPVVRGIVETMSPLGDCLTTAERAGMLRKGSVVERALLILATMQGVLQMHKQARIAPNLIDIERLSTEAIRTLLLGWGADGAAVDAALESALAVVGRPGGLS